LFSFVPSPPSHLTPPLLTLHSNMTDISKTLIKVEEEEKWDEIIEASLTKLVVVNCHPSWCGHCEAILPTISRVMMDTENSEVRFLYVAANAGKISKKMMDSFPADLSVDLETVGCLPVFAVYRVSKFNRAASPHLIISHYLPLPTHHFPITFPPPSHHIIITSHHRISSSHLTTSHNPPIPHHHILSPFTTSHHLFTSPRLLSSPLPTSYHPPLRLTISYYLSPPPTTSHCLPLPSTISHYLIITSHHLPLPHRLPPPLTLSPLPITSHHHSSSQLIIIKSHRHSFTNTDENLRGDCQRRRLTHPPGSHCYAHAAEGFRVKSHSYYFLSCNFGYICM
jgi:thiol-disulfide isomerase/thioredoxin